MHSLGGVFCLHLSFLGSGARVSRHEWTALLSLSMRRNAFYQYTPACAGIASGPSLLVSSVALWDDQVACSGNDVEVTINKKKEQG